MKHFTGIILTVGITSQGSISVRYFRDGEDLVDSRTLNTSQIIVGNISQMKMSYLMKSVN